jgi:hypothetical protein
MVTSEHAVEEYANLVRQADPVLAGILDKMVTQQDAAMLHYVAHNIRKSMDEFMQSQSLPPLKVLRQNPALN